VRAATLPPFGTVHEFETGIHGGAATGFETVFRWLLARTGRQHGCTHSEVIQPHAALV